MVDVETVVVGPIEENCYIVSSAGETMVVDPGDELDRILQALDGRKVTAIVATHRHWDHVGAVAGLARETGAPVLASAADAETIRTMGIGHVGRMVGHGDWARLAINVDRELREGDVVSVGECEFHVVETPGHTVGSICLYCADEKVLFAGDTVFSCGRFGRTDLETGDARAMQSSLRKLGQLVDDETKIYCGHEAATTMGRERSLVPYYD